MTSILSSRDAHATRAVMAEWSRRRSQMDWCSTPPEPTSLYDYKELSKGNRGDGVRVKRIKMRRSKRERGKPIVGRLRREQSLDDDSEIATAECEVFSFEDAPSTEDLTDEQLATMGKELLKKSLRRPSDRGPRGRALVRDNENLPTLPEEEKPPAIVAPPPPPRSDDEEETAAFDLEAPPSIACDEKEEIQQPPAWRGATGRGSTTKNKSSRSAKVTERYSSIGAARAAASKSSSSMYSTSAVFASAMDSARAAYYGTK